MQLGMVGLGRMGGDMTRRLMGGGHEVVVYDRSAEAIERHPDVAELFDRDGAPSLRRTTPDVLAAMASTVTPQGFVAVCRFVDTPLEDVLATKPRLVAVLVEPGGDAGT